MKKIFATLLLLMFVFIGNAYSAEPVGKIWFDEPKDGAKVKNPVKICFGADDLEVTKWSKVNKEGQGHHHILIDVDVDMKQFHRFLRPVKMIHQSKGESCHTLKKPLSIGKHTIHGLFQQNNHVPYNPTIYSTITIEVVK